MNFRVGAAQSIIVIMAPDATAGLVASGMAGSTGLKITARLGSMLRLPSQRGMALRHPSAALVAFDTEAADVMARPTLTFIGFGIEGVRVFIIQVMDYRRGVIAPVT